jgi:hypothetical protein
MKINFALAVNNVSIVSEEVGDFKQRELHGFTNFPTSLLNENKLWEIKVTLKSNGIRGPHGVSPFIGYTYDVNSQSWAERSSYFLGNVENFRI